MSLATERELIEKHLQTNWATTRIQWEDVKLTPADGETWVAVTIINGQAAQRSVGAPGTNIVRSAGVLAIRVFVPEGQGSAQFRIIADGLTALFRNTELENIRFMIPYVSGGATTMDNYSVWTVMCPFTRDEFNG